MAVQVQQQVRMVSRAQVVTAALAAPERLVDLGQIQERLDQTALAAAAALVLAVALVRLVVQVDLESK